MFNIRSHPFSAAPSEDGYWLVLGWGSIASFNRGSYDFKLQFVRLPDDINLNSPVADFIHTGRFYESKVDIGSLRLFSPGSIWKDRKLVKFINEYRNKTASLPITDSTQSTLDILGNWTDRGSKDFFVPPGLLQMPVRVFKKEHFSKDRDYDFIVIPCNAV